MSKEEILRIEQETSEKFNALLPCHTQEQIDNMIKAINAFLEIPVKPAFKIYYDGKVFIDNTTGILNDSRIIIFTDFVKFEPSDNIDEHPGLVVKQK